jgi:hypothetical protein
MRRMSQTFDFDRCLTDDRGELDPDALLDYATELVALFAEAPEGEAFEEDDDVVEATLPELVERAVRDHGVRPHQLTTPVVSAIVFEGLPRGWRHPAEAGAILDGLAAFMRFLGRAFRLPAAAECAAALEAEDAEDRLADAFRAVNRTCPDPELAMFLQEAEEPGDGDEEPRSPGPAARSREDQRKEKDKKKAAKKAKRRNRR